MKANYEAEIKNKHDQAMAACDLAIIARSKRKFTKAEKLFHQAFLHERDAARILAGEFGLEPTRSVLLRSAASLALECKEFREAEKLIATALSGEPPDEIAEELRDLLEQTNLGRHLALKGLVLNHDEFQISIDGNAVGFGMAESNEFIERVQISEKLLLRTIERKSGRPFRETGRALKEISQAAELYLSVPRAASFAVTLRIGLPQKQLGLPTIEQDALREPDKIIDDLFDCLDSFQKKDIAALERLIPNQTYRRNFIALAEQLGPDGDRVKVVGLTSSRHGGVRTVAMEKRHVEIREPKKNLKKPVTMTGRLLFANSTRTDRQTIRIIDKDGGENEFKVPEGMMADIVRPLYEETVMIIGFQCGKSMTLESIYKVSGAEPASLPQSD